MGLQKKTKVGTLMAGYKPDQIDYPGFWIDLFRKGKSMLPVCTVEYEPTKGCVQVVVYANGDSDEPTHIIPINLPREENA
jgi:hypothetical protein